MTKVLRVSRVVADLDRSVALLSALDFEEVGRSEISAPFGIGAARQCLMRLGGEEVALVQCATHGLPQPPDSASNDLWFQHIAVVVSDMDAAYARLRLQNGWTPITEGGPLLLPPENGAVRAFKFRDPDGHPMELIWFPPGGGRPVWHTAPGLFMGIDHSALAVSSIPASEAFYAVLGLCVSSRSLNQGAIQSRLDGLTDAKLDVVGLRGDEDGAGLEMLGYQPPGRALSFMSNDLAVDWVTLSGTASAELHDPDGHRVLVSQGAVAPA